MNALVALGRMLAREDPVAARRYYEKAAAHGDRRAMVNLGDMLRSRHPSEARQWYERAASAGSTYALRQLARTYELSWSTSGRPYWSRPQPSATPRRWPCWPRQPSADITETRLWPGPRKAGAASKEEDFHKLVLTYEERLLRYIGRQGALPSASRAGFECLVRMGKAGSWVLWRSKALWRRVRRP